MLLTKESINSYLHENLQQIAWNTLQQTCQNAVLSGGKRMRALLVGIGASSITASIDTKNLFPAAAAIELFHAFSLVHDDIMDNATLRRGKPTIHTTHGVPTAILTGDFLLIEAYQQLSLLPIHVVGSVLQLFNTTAKEICIGQQMDMEFEKKQQINLDEYLQMITLKTAVLVGAALQIGGILAGASVPQQEALYTIGKNIGLAFQIQDDYLDVYGNEDFGKQKGGDILAQKKSFLYLKTRQISNEIMQKSFQNIYQDTTLANADKINQTIAIYDEINIKSHTIESIDWYKNKALKIIATLPNPSILKNSMDSLFISI